MILKCMIFEVSSAQQSEGIAAASDSSKCLEMDKVNVQLITCRFAFLSLGLP